MAHIWMSRATHVTDMNASCHTGNVGEACGRLCDVDTTCDGIYFSESVRICLLISVNMTHSNVLNVAFACDMTSSYVWHDSFIRVTWLIHVCYMTHSYVWHDSFIWHASFICVTWLIHKCDKPHSYLWHESIIHMTWLNRMCPVDSTCNTVCYILLTCNRVCWRATAARPYESCKLFKGRPRRNAFSKLVHRQYISFLSIRFCQVEIHNTTGLSDKPSTA